MQTFSVLVLWDLLLRKKGVCRRADDWFMRAGRLIHDLADKLTLFDWCDKVHAIDTASVPVIKFEAVVRRMCGMHAHGCPCILCIPRIFHGHEDSRL